MIADRRRSDGSLYARCCTTCGGCWKVYQREYHEAGCSAKREGE